ncbi:transposase [Candidatus Bipolaricaulota bacterium]|nr:transposase [Candidatus Bipolaricaulota bacterium]
MVRPLRIQFEGAVYHVTSRGNAGNDIFLSDDDRVLFLEIVGDVVERFGWICHAYCLMSNHYHLLIETPEPNLSRGMRHLNGVYTQSFNRSHKRLGHIFQGRFKAILIEKQGHLLEVARYVVLNPVRAHIVAHPRNWIWSSYRATSGESQPASFLTIDWLLEQFDSQRKRALLAYRRFVKEGKGVHLWDDLRGGALLGSEVFVEQMRSLLQDAAGSQEISRAARLLAHPSLDKLFDRTGDDSEARDQRVYEAFRLHGYTLFQIQEHLGLHYSTISRIAKREAEKRMSKNKT